MPLTDAQEFEIRQWLGTTPGRAELDSVYDGTGTVRETITYVLRQRRAALLAQPKSFSIPGEYSQTNFDPESISKLLLELEDATIETETDPEPRVKRLVRFGDDCYSGR